GAHRTRRGRHRSGDRLGYARGPAQVSGRYRPRAGQPRSGDPRGGEGGAEGGGMTGNGATMSASARLVDNIVLFARTLRAAGLTVGSGAVIDAVRAVEVAGIAAREDLYWTLHAVFVKKHDQHAVFDQAF